MIGALISGIGQLFGGIAQKVGQRKQYEREKADNIALWNMQNAYNSPVEQMKRLKEAGLNENLVYQSGNAIQPAGDVSVNSSDGASGLSDIGNSFNTGYQAYLQGKSIMSQNRQRDVQSDLTEQKIKSEIKSQQLQDLIITGKELQNRRDFIDTRYKGQEKEQELRKLDAEIKLNNQTLTNLIATNENIVADTKNKISENKLKQQQSRQMQQDLEFKVKNNLILLKQGKMTLDAMLTDIALKKANIQAINQNREYTSKQMDKLQQDIKEQMINMLSKNLDNVQKVIGLKYSDKLQSIETELKEFENDTKLVRLLGAAMQMAPVIK